MEPILSRPLMLAGGPPWLAVLAAFSLLLVAAAVSDIRHRQIPNRLVLALAGLWPAHVMLAPFAVPWPSSLALLALVMAAGAGLFRLGICGAGDGKLLAVTLLWAGPAGAPAILMLTALAGGILSLVIGVLSRASPAGAARAAILRRGVPYGVAITAAGLFLVQGWLLAP